MRNVTIRSRADGITELSPVLAPLDPLLRLAVIVAVLAATWILFLYRAIPSGVAAAIAGSCVAGEVVLGLKALALALLRPPAPVLELADFGRRRR